MLFASTVVAADTPRVYIEATETVDAGNSKDKAKRIDFGSAIAAALVKKQAPVAVVTDNTKSQWTIKTVSSQKEDTTGTKWLNCFCGEGVVSRNSREPFRSSAMRAVLFFTHTT
ncbi:MAG: hypothetical protein ABI665_11055 [Vicinamibacterales bacterium]